MTDQSLGLQSKLFNEPFADMSEREAKLLMEQYILYVEMTDKVSERRHQANSFFLTVNTIIVTALTGLVSLTQEFSAPYSWAIVPALTGIVFCLSWRRLIQSYGQLNRGKFKIIHLLETRLPASQFNAEWDALNHGDGTVYKPFTQTEMNVPLVFVGIYLILALFAVLIPIFG